MAITTGIATLAVGAYSAYDSHKTGNKGRGLAGEVNSRQRYYNDLLTQLMEHPESIFDDPGYKAIFAQGTQAVERSSAARGFTGSGNTAIALQDWGQGFANQYLQEQRRLLAGLSGAGGNTSPAQYLAVGQASNNSSFDQFGQVLAGLGYMYGNGAANSGNVMASGSGGTLDPGQMDAGGGYIWNVPGTGTDG